MNKITTVIFDIGNVLAGFNWKSHIESKGFSEDINDQLGDIMFKSPLWRERDRGHKSEIEYKQMFIDEAPELEYEINKVFEGIINLVEIYPFATEWVKSVKAQGKKVYVLSNYNKISFENDIHKFDFLNYIDGKLISYEVNHVKPEKEIYEILLKKYNIVPNETVFLDDSKENVDAASKLGIHAIHVTSHDKAVEELKRFEIY
ncbi:MAG: HAD family phosphatase [Eubacteriales bacterium]